MSGKYQYEGLNGLTSELGRTRTISEDFKNEILGYAFQVASEAYQAGIERGKEIQAKEIPQEKKRSSCDLCDDPEKGLIHPRCGIHSADVLNRIARTADEPHHPRGAEEEVFPSDSQ